MKLLSDNLYIIIYYKKIPEGIFLNICYHFLFNKRSKLNLPGPVMTSNK